MTLNELLKQRILAALDEGCDDKPRLLSKGESLVKAKTITTNKQLGVDPDKMKAASDSADEERIAREKRDAARGIA